MERLRRTMMFVPGANAAMLRDAPLYGADSIMFDLEDSVSLKEKDTSRALVHFALKTFDYSSVETVVRVNALDTVGALDIEAVVIAGVNVVRLPKTETAQDIIDVEAVIERVERENGIVVGRTKMMAAIESAEGVLNAREIAKASDRLIGIALGAEDYVTNMKTRRHPDGQELFFARSMILHAARAAGIAAIDTVYSDVNNTEGFQNEVRMIKQLGFDGKSVINPRQIPLVNEVYAPTEKEIQDAKEVIWAIREAESKGSGVISLKGKMVDKPIVERAERVIMLAKAAQLLTEEDI
ncbi:citrate (pro-3S)-lyase subunit beta [Streptococcus pseudoporcinus]|uniref:Citrate lyase subunit beta n=1 Tax=Streptococcus pseudoporcinus TaxID=361101 RepID=A0A4U9YAD3_9STRE|nr:citrate (pro-3S)-lyase subunit beta [Streptococcus pseudoporcinus]VTS23189.1 citrate lyase beta chain / citryl-CoA lyase subunit [Streptococcus pseudoporcinus]VUC70589.1 citrate lyase beta chain / citryl-CoA lyase subunit [Streptococcus pseudoporcinus]VUD00405.1 citrate lyase beta chain / citryl-CoA lyase subunit [Streptococcus pseudoporcinus]VUD00782.1 citrate lyase beta chain / citryl-CoA lyase subunit [Streptococcus pseudoporcinus]